MPARVQQRHAARKVCARFGVEVIGEQRRAGDQRLQFPGSCCPGCAADCCPAAAGCPRPACAQVRATDTRPVGRGRRGARFARAQRIELQAQLPSGPAAATGAPSCRISSASMSGRRDRAPRRRPGETAGSGPSAAARGGTSARSTRAAAADCAAARAAMHGTHATGRAFGPQRQTVAVAVVEGVHLLLDDVGHLADRTLEQFGLLDHAAGGSRDSRSRAGARARASPGAATRRNRPAARRPCREWPVSVRTCRLHSPKVKRATLPWVNGARSIATPS